MAVKTFLKFVNYAAYVTLRPDFAPFFCLTLITKPSHGRH